MEFNNIDWADSNIDRIEIEYDCAKLFVFNDTLQKQLIVKFNGFIGMTKKIDLREQVIDFDKQSVITKDNVMTEINALLYFQIVDPVKSVYEIKNLPLAIEKLTQTTLRNVVGEMELDETLTSRDTINNKLQKIRERCPVKQRSLFFLY